MVVGLDTNAVVIDLMVMGLDSMDVREDSF